MMKNNSPLRYPGGKSALTPYIKSYINNFNVTAYAEPFAGGAGVALNLLTENIVPKILLNDKDPAVYSIWHNILYSTENFIDFIQNISVNMTGYQKQKQFYKSHSRPSFELGCAAFFLNRTNVSGVLTGGPIGGTAQTGKYKLDCRFNKVKLAEKIRKISRLEDRIEIYNKDFSEFLENHTDPTTFVYLDPPYVIKGKTCYAEYMTEKHHTDLYEHLRIADYPWILSYDDCEIIRNLYQNYCITPVYLNYSAANKGSSQEILISKNDLKKPDF